MRSSSRLVAALIVSSVAAGCRGAGDDHAAHPAGGPLAVAPEHPAGGHAGSAGGMPATPPGMAEVEVAPERRQLTGVRTAELRVRPLAHEIRTVGLVVADERRLRRIQTKVSGWIERLFVAFTGERVVAGQPILALYSPELVASQREYLLALETFEGGAATGLEAKERHTLLESAERRLALFDVEPSHLAELRRTRDPTRRIVLHSPTSGIVTFKSVLEGTYVTPEMELYTVSDLDQVWVWADVTENEIPFVAVGQSAAIEFSSDAAARAGSVAFLQPTLDVATRTLRVRFDVENRDGALRPGMYATVRIEQRIGDVLALPEEAVIDTGVRRLVFVEVADGRYQPREVSLGRKGADAYQVLGGLAAGERVAVSAQFLLDSESRLRGVAAPAHAGH